MNSANQKTVTVGAMHQTLENRDFSECIHCGAWAEELKTPCPKYLHDVAAAASFLAEEPKQ